MSNSKEGPAVLSEKFGFLKCNIKAKRNFNVCIILRMKTEDNVSSDKKGPFNCAQRLISSKQNMWKTTITACLEEFKHINIPKLLLLTVKSSGVFFPWEVSAAEAPLASPQSSLPHHSLLAPQSG